MSEKVDEALRACIRACIEECVEYLCKQAQERIVEFTSADIERLLAERYPGIWAQALLKYGVEGRFTIRNLVGITLDALSRRGIIQKIGEKPAPPDWGFSRIVAYRCKSSEGI